jgi:hypothetical protein
MSQHATTSKTWRIIRTALPGALAIGLAALVVMTEVGTLPKPGFYETAAQIIPVLIVALAIEGHAQKLWSRLRFAYKLQVFFCLALGELAAILAAAGTFAASPRTVARQIVADWDLDLDQKTMDAAIKAEPGRYADIFGLPDIVVRRAIRQRADDGGILVKVVEEWLNLRLTPDDFAVLVGPNIFWSNVLAGVTISGLVFGFLAVLTCAFLPEDRVRLLLEPPEEDEEEDEEDEEDKRHS